MANPFFQCIWQDIFGCSPDRAYMWKGSYRLRFRISFLDRDISTPREVMLLEANLAADAVRSRIIRLGLEDFINVPVLRRMTYTRTANVLVDITNRGAVRAWHKAMPKELFKQAKPLAKQLETV